MEATKGSDALDAVKLSNPNEAAGAGATNPTPALATEGAKGSENEAEEAANESKPPPTLDLVAGTEGANESVALALGKKASLAIPPPKDDGCCTEG